MSEEEAYSLWILEDTRQQANKHNAKHQGFERMGVRLHRSKLAFGDYCLPPKVSVDTKKDLYELSQDLTADHERFRRECENAAAAGTRLIVLTENRHGVTDLESLAKWEEPLKHFEMRKRRSKNRYSQRIKGERLAKTCATMTERYSVAFRFCKPSESHLKIIKYLKWNGGKPL
jgi:hypothetical protein